MAESKYQVKKLESVSIKQNLTGNRFRGESLNILEKKD